MKRHMWSLLLMISSLTGLPGQASAAPLVVGGSNYAIFIQGSDSGARFNGSAVFDSSASVFTRAGLTVTLTESEQTIGINKSLITLNVAANGDLFPSAFDEAWIGLGVFGNGLDFATPVVVDDARILMYIGSDLVFTSSNLVGHIGMNNPWDGAFPSLGSVFAITAGGVGVSGFSFVFEATAVPEPGSLLLGCIGLIALAGTRLRRRRAEVIYHRHYLQDPHD